MKRYYWSAISRDERHKAIGEITDTVNRHAIVLNFQRFSDLALSLLLEVEAGKLPALFADLNSILSLNGGDPESTSSANTCLVFLNITFARGTGNLAIEVPEVPG